MKKSYTNHHLSYSNCVQSMYYHHQLTRHLDAVNYGRRERHASLYFDSPWVPSPPGPSATPNSYFQKSI